MRQGPPDARCTDLRYAAQPMTAPPSDQPPRHHRRGSYQNNHVEFQTKAFAEFNAKGRIQPEPLLKAFAEGGALDNEICLELSFKEREPNDRQVIPQIAESIAFWAPHIDTGASDLKLG